MRIERGRVRRGHALGESVWLVRSSVWGYEIYIQFQVHESLGVPPLNAERVKESLAPRSGAGVTKVIVVCVHSRTNCYERGSKAYSEFGQRAGQ